MSPTTHVNSLRVAGNSSLLGLKRMPSPLINKMNSCSETSLVSLSKLKFEVSSINVVHNAKSSGGKNPFSSASDVQAWVLSYQTGPHTSVEHCAKKGLPRAGRRRGVRIAETRSFDVANTRAVKPRNCTPSHLYYSRHLWRTTHTRMRSVTNQCVRSNRPQV